MAESDLSTQEWSAADDELVRSALDSLRLDVELLPLNTPARPQVRRIARHRTLWLSAAATLAATAAVATAVSLSGAPGSGQVTINPGTASSTAQGTTSPTGTATSSDTPTATTASGPSQESPGALDWAAMLRLPGILPVGAGWGAARGRRAPVAVLDAPGIDTDPLCGMPTGAGSLVAAQEVRASGAPAPFAIQRTWRYDAAGVSTTALSAMTAALDDCSMPAPVGGLTPASSDEFEEHPMLWSFTTDQGDTGWVILSQVGTQVSYIELFAPMSTQVTLRQIARVSAVAAERLAQS